MKKFLFFALVATLAFGFSQSSLAQGNREAAKLAQQGAAASKEKDWDTAVDAFRKATELDSKQAPNLAAALQQRATVYMNQQQFQEAIADLTEALQVTPKDAKIHERRAYIYMKTGDLDKALVDYSEAIKLEANEARYYAGRGYIYETKGDLQNAMADTEKVLKLDKKNKEALARKERLAARMKRAAEMNPPAPTPPIPATSPAAKKKP